MRYFAYGSNLDLADFGRFFDSIGEAVPPMQTVGPAWLADHELVFDVASARRGGGVLNIRHSPGRLVEGVLFDVEPTAWPLLDRKEGAPHAYQRERVTVLTPDGGAGTAITYKVPVDRTHGFVAPSDAYLAVVRSGRQAHGLGKQAVEDAAIGRRPQVEVPAFFVYGTLMRGERNHPVVDRHGLTCALLAECFGRLDDTGAGHPGMVLPLDDSREMVRGEFLIPRHFDRALQALDQLEGFGGFGASGNLFERRLVTVGIGGRIRRAWTYVPASRDAHARRIESGCWRAHRGLWERTVGRLFDVHEAGRPDFARRVWYRQHHFAVPQPDPPADCRARILADVLAGEVSERMLAKMSGNWTAALD